MNAEELATILDQKFSFDGGAGNIGLQAADMIRKQAAEIKNLQDQFDKAIEYLAKANNMIRSR
jgi:hypothetical protein